MSDHPIRRFSRFAIVFHWMIGLPYMALLASGGLIVLQRADLLQWNNRRIVELVHLWIGVALCIVIVQGIFAAIVTGKLGSICRDAAEWITIRPRDLVWFLKAPLNIFWPKRFPLPAVGRYNAGQKIHGLFIMLALVGFMITGIRMILAPADLRPWIVHSWLAYAAAGFLAIHLYLGLVNRATRPALRGIVTGYVARAYVEHHHPLELESGEVSHTEPGAVVSWRALAGTWAVALLLAGGLLRAYGPEQAATQAMRIRGQELASITPGPLSHAHAADPRTASCTACHSSLQEPRNSACLACHTEIRAVIKDRLGHHGKLAGECRDCHSEHKGADASLIQFDPATFNHDLARFKLAGEHRTARCDKCHSEHAPVPGVKRFIGLSQACAACHADPHDKSLGTDCRKCHSPEGWKGRDLLFVHNRDAGFRIDAVHGDLTCSACHATTNGTVQFRLSEKTCESCHRAIADAISGTIDGVARTPDPHAGRVQCADCHVPEIHAPTAEQYAARCVQCHGTRYRGLYYDWQRSLAEQTQSARESIAQQDDSDPARSKSLSHKLDVARQIGMHHVEAAAEILSTLNSKQSNRTVNGGQQGGVAR